MEWGSFARVPSKGSIRTTDDYSGGSIRVINVTTGLGHIIIIIIIIGVAWPIVQVTRSMLRNLVVYGGGP